ncbi:MAG: ribosome silencing factor [Desulfomonilaceae bacterium]|nr:ribosome silencing factor [Desulfomonilaceae bacterium]
MKKHPSRDEAPTLTPKETAEILLRAALSKKAGNPVLIRLQGLTTLADYFLIVSGRSSKQVKAIAEAVLTEAKKHGIERLSAEGTSHGHWALLDYGDVIVHVFHTPVREFYDLEGLWAEAPREQFTGDLAREIEASEKSLDEDEIEDEDDFPDY